MFINLLRNAADAVLQLHTEEIKSNGLRGQDVLRHIVVSWSAGPENIIISIEDDGPGLMNPSNAFVPFYTTKPAGSGIGLVLSRQIAEAHGGSLELFNRAGERGCIVRITMPLKKHASNQKQTSGIH